MRCSPKFFLLLLALVCAVCPVLAQAALTMQGSRVIYEESQGEVVAQLRQVGEMASLIQVWLDSGTDSLEGQLEETPFLITPSVARIDPGKGQTIRFLRAGGGLPQDRESMFFLNVLEVPAAVPGQIGEGDNYLQFSSRMRLKFFYRPKGLKLRPEQAWQQLRFSLLSGQGDQNEIQVRIANPSPYHVTFKHLALHADGQESAPALAELSPTVGPHQSTVPPMGELVLPLKAGVDGLRLSASGVQVAFGIINDFGSLIAGRRGLD